MGYASKTLVAALTLFKLLHNHAIDVMPAISQRTLVRPLVISRERLATRTNVMGVVQAPVLDRGFLHIHTTVLVLQYHLYPFKFSVVYLLFFDHIQVSSRPIAALASSMRALSVH